MKTASLTMNGFECLTKKNVNVKSKIYHTLYKYRTPIFLIGIPLTSFLISRAAYAGSPIWTITEGFGVVSDVHPTPHKGIDFAMPEGTPLDSIVDGVVSDVRHTGSRGWGTSVHIRDTHGREVIYGHLSDVKVQVGQEISKGDMIALSGNTGRSTGAHLHLEIRINGVPVNPIRDIIGAGLSGK